ncbi:MAG: GNAT family N-acetyltransferase [Chitinophagales bacterium]
MPSSNNQITFRKATPSDVAQAVPLIYSSGPDVCEFMFYDAKKGSAQNFFAYGFTRSGGELGYDNHTCILIDNKVVGIGAIWNGKKTFSFMLADIKKIFAFFGFFKGLMILFRALKVEMLIPPPKKKEWVIAHLAIDSTITGKGLGTKLIHYLIDSVSIKPDEKTILDVSFINPKAQKLYERLGFKVTKKKESKLQRKKYNVKVPGHYRMERE